MNYFYKHIFRSSRLQMFFKIGALKNFTTIRIKETPTQVFSCKKQPHDLNMLIDFLLKLLSQLYQPSITPFSQNIYHQLLWSCEIAKFLIRAFLQNTSRSSCLQMVLKIVSQTSQVSACVAVSFLKTCRLNLATLLKKDFNTGAFP